MLEVSGLCVDYVLDRGDVRAVDDVSFTVGRGEFLGIVGESGCGKTTTLLAILGLLPRGAQLVAGSVCFAGRDLRTAGPRALREVLGDQIGVIWQDPLAALDPVMRVGSQIAEAVRAHRKVDRRGADTRAKELMRLVELPDVDRLFGAYPHQLSGGQRQRTAASWPSVSPTRLAPWKVTLPAAMRAGGASSWAMANSRVDFPQPDSPTIPRNSPRPTVKDTSSTARTSVRSST